MIMVRVWGFVKSFKKSCNFLFIDFMQITIDSSLTAMLLL